MQPAQIRPPRILIIRLSALGDTALTLPLLATLRKELPEAYIGWAVEEKSCSLLEGHPFIDKLHIWKMAEKNLRGAWRLSREIAAEKYDAALDAQGLTKSAALALLAGIKTRVGFARRPLEARELSPIFNNRLVMPPAELSHIALRTQYLAAALGVNPPYYIEKDCLTPPAEPLAAMKRWWQDIGLNGKKTLIFGVGTSWVTKIWPVEHMAKIVKLAEDKGYKAVVTWGPDEEAKLPQWREILGGDVLWSPQTKSVADLVALLSLCDAYAGPDSAPLHIAWLQGKPTFSWFGPSDSFRGAPVGKNQQHVVAYPATRQRKGDMMWSLTPETVLPFFADWLDSLQPITKI